MRRVADDHDLWMAWKREVRLNQHTSGAVRLGAEPHARGRGRHARRPEDRLRADALTGDHDALVVHLLHRLPQAHLDAQPLQARARASSASDCGKALSRRGAASTRRMRAIAGSMWRKSSTSAKRESSATAPASSTPVGPPPMITKLSSCARFSALQQAGARPLRTPTARAGESRPRLSMLLQSRRVVLPLVVPEVRGVGAPGARIR